ncbi:MAG: immune inhibitor A [Anaerolineae bacterium]|nr:immune inhibitor A [Anaerolineae bacterium]
MRRTLVPFVLGVLLLSCVCLLGAAVAWMDHVRQAQGSAAIAQSTPVPPTSQPPRAHDTGAAIAAAHVPQRDSRLLAQRLRPATGPIPLVVSAEPPPSQVGDVARFWVSNSDTLEMFQVTATLRYVSEHAEIWVQDGLAFDQVGLERAAQHFDERIYPTVHRYFGSEWTPGVDGNPRITILNARFSGAAGYYSSQDEVSRQVNPYSNEREMIYVNADAAFPGTTRYAAIVAHEFQHMVHYHQDANEDSWVNEGCSELAAWLCGFGATGAVGSFGRRSDTQLNNWVLSPDEDPLPHYGASYLWLGYFLQRLGPDVLKSTIAEQANGIEGFERVLSQTPDAPALDDLFADWVVANLLDDRSLVEGRYGHEAAEARISMAATHRELPVDEAGSVSQYGTDYIAIARQDGPVRIEFAGDPKVAVVPNEPYQGRLMWWSNRGDMSNTSLTRAFDLSRVRQATLRYAIWYELEDGWDYAYVEVSTDGGATWKLLTTPHTTEYNPNGNAFGPGYTGFSGHPPGSETRLTAQWVREEIDLSSYAGQQILVRFEMATDDAVNLPGLCIDDISVPEIGFVDGAESELAGWEAEGFVRIDNELPQSFLVQVIEQGLEVRIQRLRLDGGQRGILTVDGFGRGTQQAILAVSGLTRHTTETAGYRYSIAPVGD